MRVLKTPLEFEWDKGNTGKNLIKHGVSDEECEEVFFDAEKKVLKDTLHSNKEGRYILVGETKGGRPLFVVFTARKSKIRVISARNLNKREIKTYYEKKT